MKKDYGKMNYFGIFFICLKVMIKRARYETLAWGILNIVASIIPSIIIVLNRNIINDITERQTYKILVMLLLATGIIQIFGGLIDASKNYIYQLIKKEVDYYIYKELYKKLTSMPLEKFEDSEYYNMVEMANKAVEMNGIDNIKYVIDIISAIITVFGVIFVLVAIHWSLPIALFLSMVPGFIGIIIAKSMKYNNAVDLIPAERMQSYISSLFFSKSSLKEIRIFKITNYLINKWSIIFSDLRTSRIKILLKESKINFTGNNIIQISTVLVNMYLIYNIYLNNITLGDYVALTQAVVVLQSKIGNVAMNVGELFEIGLYNKSLFKILNEDNIEIIDDDNSLVGIQSLELKNVSFNYPNSEKKVLNNISLKINKGERVAIVGYNGSGKSTLINILLGIYTEIDGTYEINGIKIDNSIVSKYQTKMTAILQDFIHYKMPIRENIGFGNIKHIKNDKLLKSKLEEVGLKDKVDELPNNIDTVLSKEFIEGTELSGGQWQKIAIARSMIKDSEIVIFDEPTSALDPIAELEIFNLLNNVSRDKTTIMISHRLGITKFADTIILMKNGRIIESGTHKELIQRNDEYKNMYEAQAAYYR